MRKQGMTVSLFAKTIYVLESRNFFFFLLPLSLLVGFWFSLVGWNYDLLQSHLQNKMPLIFMYFRFYEMHALELCFVFLTLSFRILKTDIVWQ